MSKQDETPDWLKPLLPLTDELKKLGFEPHGWDYGTITMHLPNSDSRGYVTFSVDDAKMLLQKAKEYTGE